MEASHALINWVAQATVEILLNSLWQGLALTLLVWLVLRAMRRANAATRYGFLCATLLAFIALPVFNGLSLGRETESVIPPLVLDTVAASPAAPALPSSLQTSGSMAAVKSAGTALHQEHESASRNDSTPVELKAVQRVDDARQSVGADALTPPGFFSQKIELPNGNWLLPLFALWLVIAAMRSGQVCRSFWRLHQLKRGAQPLAPEHQDRLLRLASDCRIKRKVRLGGLAHIDVPMVVGMFDPMILFPHKLLDALTGDEFELILLHELAHVRRWDDWTNMGQKLIEAVFFFHPAVLWVGRRLNLEREIACDDQVISLKRESRRYAVCLARLAELTLLPKRASLAPGAIFSKNQIFSRVELLLKRSRNANPQISKLGLLVPLGALMIAITQCLLLTPVFAVSEKPSGDARRASDGQATVELKREAAATTSAESANGGSNDGALRRDTPQISLRMAGEQSPLMPSVADGAYRSAAFGDVNPAINKMAQQESDDSQTGETGSASRTASLMGAINRLSSSWDKADALIAVLGEKTRLDSVPAGFFEAVKTISSPMDKTRVLSALLLKRPDRRLLTQTLSAITFIETESDKRDLLVTAARVCPNDDGVFEVYLQVAAVLHSSSDQESVLSALLDRSDLSRNVLLRTKALALDKIASTQSQQHVLSRVNLRLAEKSRTQA